MRLFVAVNVPAVAPGKDSPAVGGEAPAHLTLKFLGETPEDRVGRLQHALESVARQFQPFRVELRGVGAFPSPQRPRVVWVGVSEGSGQLVALAGAVDRGVHALGFPMEDRPFVPHLTLFRIRTASDHKLADAWLSGEPNRSFGSCMVQELLLKKSDLLPRGAVHSTLARLEFGPSF